MNRLVTPGFLAQRRAKIINDMADQHADMAVLLVITNRMDATIGGLLGEISALHG